MDHKRTSLVAYTPYILLVLTAGSIQGAANQAKLLSDLGNDFWDFRAESRPEFSTYVNEYRFNDRMMNDNYTDVEPQYTKTLEFLDRLKMIDRGSLTSSDQVTYDIMQSMLDTFKEGYQWKDFGVLNRFNFLEGMQVNPSTMLAWTPVDTWGDIINYFSRLLKIPQQLEEQIENARKAIRENLYTLHNVSVNRIPSQIDKMMVDNPTEFILYKPFNDTLESMDTVPAGDKTELRTRASDAIQAILDKYTELKEFLVNEYMPNTRSGYGASTLGEEGSNFYRAALKWHASIDVTPEEIHQKGQNEVLRISQHMQNIMTNLGHSGSIRSFFEAADKEERFHRNTSEELLVIYNEMIGRAEDQLSIFFDDYAGLPVKVVPMVNDGPRGTYSRGSEDGTRPGVFYVNNLIPRDMPTFSMPSLLLHETIPGHHLQIGNYELKSKVPTFRKNTNYDMSTVPTAFPRYTAFVEGWALYAESLGEEMGMYRDDYELMGRYASEMFRACRMVVDTGIHFYRWDRETAIEFMLNYTALPRSTVQTEIDRYITWPGQACSYKIGELKIKELRTLAESELGDDFNIKEFHSVVVGNAAMPLSVLDNLVRNWITGVKVKNVNENNLNVAVTVNASLLIVLLPVTLSYITNIY